MRLMTKSAILIGLLIASLQVASATTVSSGQSLLFNFDLSGASPSPIYSQVGLIIILSGYDSGESATGACFTDPNAGGIQVSEDCFPPSGPTVSWSRTFGSGLSNGFTDGVFSMRLNDVTGTFDITSICAVGEKDGQKTDCMQGALVPEPGTLALLGLGLAGLSLSRRRKAH